jgi:hypothetical protein
MCLCSANCFFKISHKQIPSPNKTNKTEESSGLFIIHPTILLPQLLPDDIATSQKKATACLVLSTNPSAFRQMHPKDLTNIHFYLTD